MSTEYTVERIPMAAFYIEEGWYSIEQIEEMLENFRKAKEIQDHALDRATSILKRGEK